MGGWQHPPFRVRLRPLLIERPHVVPGGRRIEVAHQDPVRVAGLADHDEGGQAESALRELTRRHRPLDRVESAELAFRGHASSESEVLFQVSPGSGRGHAQATSAWRPRPCKRRTFIRDGPVARSSMARNLYFLGTAGSGKSTMVYAFQMWMNSQGLDCVTVNLDPGAESLQYSPDLDVRDYVDLREIMEEQDLGPNGAQVAAADMIAMNARELAEVLETSETSYILLDTPGQIELFTFRQSGPVLIDAFGREDSALVYLNDPALVKAASGFVSSVLLSATVQFRHGLPFVNVLSKADLLSEEELAKVMKWSQDPFALYEGLFADGATPKTLLDVEFLKSMESIGVYRRVHPVSSEITFGFDEVYNQVQQVFEGGEDLQKD